MMTLGEFEKNLKNVDLKGNCFNQFSLLSQLIVKYVNFKNICARRYIKEALPANLFTDVTLKNYVNIGLKYCRKGTIGASKVPSTLIKAIDYYLSIHTSKLTPKDSEKYVERNYTKKGKLNKTVVKIDNINSENKKVVVKNKRINDKIFDGNYLIRFNNMISTIESCGISLDKSFIFIKDLINIYSSSEDLRDIMFSQICDNFCKYLLEISNVSGNDLDNLLTIILKIRNNDKKVSKEILND